MEKSGRLLGVNIAAGVAYLALVNEAAVPDLDDAIKMVPAKGLTGATRLKDFADRFLQELRRLDVKTVAIAHTRRPMQWKYTDAFERVSIEAAIMLTAETAGIRCISVKQDKEAADLVGISKPEQAEEELADALGLKGYVKHWKNRAVALMVAVAAAKGAGR